MCELWDVFSNIWSRDKALFDFRTAVRIFITFSKLREPKGQVLFVFLTESAEEKSFYMSNT